MSNLTHTQYGVRWLPDGPVFAYDHRRDAEYEMREKGRGVLMAHDYEPGTSNSTGWYEVATETTPEGDPR